MFFYWMERYEALNNKTTEYAWECFTRALCYAPPEIIEAFRAKARELDLLPETEFVDEEGYPVFSAEQIARKFNIPVSEIKRQTRELKDQEPGFFAEGKIYRLN
jgi:hypothetical protein